MARLKLVGEANGGVEESDSAKGVPSIYTRSGTASCGHRIVDTVVNPGIKLYLLIKIHLVANYQVTLLNLSHFLKLYLTIKS